MLLHCAKALTKHKQPNVCFDARFLHVFFSGRQLMKIQKKASKNRASQQKIGPSYFDRALVHTDLL
jgi:hypothetical protein